MWLFASGDIVKNKFTHLANKESSLGTWDKDSGTFFLNRSLVVIGSTVAIIGWGHNRSTVFFRGWFKIKLIAGSSGRPQS